MEYNGNPESVGYKIRYSRADGRGRTLSHVVADREEREFTIEDLEEWTEYRVQLQALNAIGGGPWSPPVVARTRESGTVPAGLPKSNPHTSKGLLCQPMPLLPSGSQSEHGVCTSKGPPGCPPLCLPGGPGQA